MAARPRRHASAHRLPFRPQRLMHDMSAGATAAGRDGLGRCPAPASVHDMGFDDYMTGGWDWTG